MKMEKINFIVFDLDGTLVDSSEDIADAVNFTLRRLGLKEKGLKEIISYIGGGVKELIRKSVGGKDFSALLEAVSIFNGYYSKHFADKTTLYPSVRDVLEHFKDKRKVVVTNRNYETAFLTLKSLGIDGYFEDIIGGDDAKCLKPSPCPLDKAMARLNIDDKKRAMIVGDMDIDILTGKAGGILTCAVTYGIGKREDILKAKPDYIIDDLSKLKDIIEKHANHKV